MPALTLEPSNLFIVADGMGGQQAGEQASLMAVELIPKAIARRLPPDETEPEPDQGSDPRRGRRGQPGDPGQLRGGHRILQHGDDRRPGPVPLRPRLRRRDRRLARLPAPRRPARAAHQGPLAGRRPARRRHDHRRKSCQPQVQERPVPLPRQQGRPRRPRGGPGARRPARRPVPAGQRRPDRRRPRRGAGQSPGHGRRPPARRRDAQGPGARQRLEGQRHLPGHPRRRAERRAPSGRRPPDVPRRSSGRQVEPCPLDALAASDGDRGVWTMLPARRLHGQRRHVGTGSARSPGAGPGRARPRAGQPTRPSGWRAG